MRSREQQLVVLLSVILLVMFASLFAVILRPKRRINVILITVDTLRADHLGAYGYRRNTSPHLDRFAKEGIVFRQAFSHAPATNPSLSSLMTSLYPHETKVRNILDTLPADVVTLAEFLKERGYHTAAFASNYLLRQGSGFEQGFEVVMIRWKTRQLVWGTLRESRPR